MGEALMRAGLFWLNDRQWASMAPQLPTNLTGPAREDDRRIISGIVHMLQCGARWRVCAREYLVQQRGVQACPHTPTQAEDRPSKGYAHNIAHHAAVAGVFAFNPDKVLSRVRSMTSCATGG